MELTGKITLQEWQDANKLFRTWMFWPKILLKNAYGGMLLLALCIGTVVQAVSGNQRSWGTIGLIWLVVAAIGAWATWSVKRKQRKGMALLNSTRPDVVELGDKILMRSANGNFSSQEWSTFNAWRENGTAVVLDRQDHAGTLVFGVSALSDVEREQLRSVLQKYLPPSA